MLPGLPDKALPSIPVPGPEAASDPARILVPELSGSLWLFVRVGLVWGLDAGEDTLGG